MNIWERITGSDITKKLRGFNARVKKLPLDYQRAWKEIQTYLWPHSDFTSRNLLPIFEGVLFLLEETSAEGQSAKEALGDDIKGFCSALVGEAGVKNYRDKWREQLNSNVARKLARLGE